MFFVLGWTIIHGPVNERSFEHSFSREAHDPFGASCEPTARSHWRCEISDPSGNLEAAYGVVVDDGSCWHGRLLPEGADRDTPAAELERVDGCVILLRDR